MILIISAFARLRFAKTHLAMGKNLQWHNNHTSTRVYIVIFVLSHKELDYAISILDTTKDSMAVCFRVVLISSIPDGVEKERVSVSVLGNAHDLNLFLDAIQAYEYSLILGTELIALNLSIASKLHIQLKKLSQSNLNDSENNQILDKLRRVAINLEKQALNKHKNYNVKKSFVRPIENLSTNAVSSKPKLRINIVNYEAQENVSWIFTRICERLARQLEIAGLEIEVSNYPMTGFDVIHHIPYHAARPINTSINTSYITHVDSLPKWQLVKWQAQLGIHGICMSISTARALNNKFKESFFHFIVPPASRYISQRQFKVGLFFNCYSDGRKRDTELLEFAKNIDPNRVSLVIMGTGWEKYLCSLQALRVNVEIHHNFEAEQYELLLKEVDYVLYFGFDEGAISISDALACAKKVVATPQGFHLDYKSPLIRYALNGYEAACVVMLDIDAAERTVKLLRLLDWSHYAAEHIFIWQKLLEDKSRIKG